MTEEQKMHNKVKNNIKYVHIKNIKKKKKKKKKLIFPLAFPVNCLGFRKLFRDYNIDYSFSVFTTED